MEDGAARSVRGILLAELLLVSVLLVVLFQYTGIAALVMGLAVFWYYYRMSMRRFGGITGIWQGIFSACVN